MKMTALCIASANKLQRPVPVKDCDVVVASIPIDCTQTYTFGCGPWSMVDGVLSLEIRRRPAAAQDFGLVRCVIARACTCGGGAVCLSPSVL